GHCCAGEIADLGSVHSVAEGVEKSPDPKRNIWSELDDVRGRNPHELRKSTIVVQSEDFGARADVTLTGPALLALAANHVHFGGDVIANVQILALAALAETLDESAELVAVNTRQMHGIANGGIPVIDV